MAGLPVSPLRPVTPAGNDLILIFAVFFQLPLTRNQPVMLRRVASDVRTSCGKDSLRKMIIVPKAGFTLAMTDMPVGP